MTDSATLAESLRKYPAFIIPVLDLIPDALPEEKRRLVRRLATAIGDEGALRIALGLDPEDFANFYPDLRHAELSTESTIASFIDRFAPAGPATASDDIEALIVPVAAPYSFDDADGTPLPGDEARPADETDSAIDAFLSAVPPKSPRAPRKPAPPTPEIRKELEHDRPRHKEPELSETLAKVMIKNGNYSKALEIITELNLKNPKKSIYFADQIRFLKKLIANQALS